MGRKSNLLLMGCGGAEAAAGFTDPSDLTDSLWWDATDTSTITSDGSTAITNGQGAQTWTHKGSFASARTWTQTSAGAKPIWTDNSGDSYLSFDGTADYMTLATTMFGAALGTFAGVTFWLRYTGSAVTTRGVVMEGSSSEDNSVYALIQAASPTDELAIWIRSVFVPPVTTYNSTSGTITSKNDDGGEYGVAVVVDNTNGDVRWFRDGTEDASSPVTFNTTAGPVANVNTNRAGLGALNRSSVSAFGQFDLRQLVVIPREATPQELSDMATWLAST